jgi:prefoldin subunit 5
MSSDDSEVLAQQVSGLQASLARLERRMAEVERVNARLEQAALTTARAMEEISGHWDAVYEAMRRKERHEPDDEPT